MNNLKMSDLKSNYKQKHIMFYKHHNNIRLHFIISNYTHEVSTEFIGILKQINVIIPNSVKYVNKRTVEHNYFNFEQTNNLKCYENDSYENINNGDTYVFEYCIKHKKNHHGNFQNIIFRNSLLCINNDVNLKNIFLLENLKILKIKYYEQHLKKNIVHNNNNSNIINICDNKKIIIFKNTNTLHIIECLVDINNLMMLRNIYKLFLRICNLPNHVDLDVSVLCNVHKILFESCHHLLKINKLTKNKILIIYDFSKYENNKLKFSCMYFTKLLINNIDPLKKNIKTGTVRILCLFKHNETLNKTTNKYVDYLLKFK